MSDKYVLDAEGNPVPCGSLFEWGQFMNQKDVRSVALDNVGDVRVSTVFLGLDHSFGGATPILYETMVFGGKLDQEQERYATKAEAEAGHAVMLARVKAEQP